MTKKADYLVIGGGLAGLTFAMHAAKTGTVLVLNKASDQDSASDKAQGGIASVMSEDDSFESHEQDTLRSGAGLCHEDVVKMCTSAGPQAIKELVNIGVEFSRNKQMTETFDLGKEGGHSNRRILHAGDFTGHEVMTTLVKAAKAQPNIQILDHQTAIDLIMDHGASADGPRCLGAYSLDQRSGAIETYCGRCTVLATGGAGKVYLYTSNPDIASGDGIAMAYRAGAEMANLEFVQFHPTCLYHPQAKSFLLSEAMRGEGGVLKLANGQEFLHKYDERGSLATRDIVARAIDNELKKRGDDHVLLDMTGLDHQYLVNRFPNIHRRCMEFGLDMRTDPLPVVPAAHYFCGGIRTDTRGRTSVAGLYAVGESACTGFHGANRLASNSLLEALVFGKKATLDARVWIESVSKSCKEPPDWDPGNAVDSDEMVVVSQNWDEIRRLMTNYVGIVRSDKRLERALRRINMMLDEIQEYYWNFLLTPDLVELRNISIVAQLVIHSAAHRKESRGLHYTLDYPSLNDQEFKADTIMKKGPDKTPRVIHTDLPYEW